jgi:bifunctional non-homologous end joining protein LigD
MRHYASVAPFILPVTAERPLVLKRFPSGVAGKFFFQQNAPDDAPESVRVEMVEREQSERAPRLVGGDLATLLYTVQLGAIAVDPWHGRVGSLDFADYTVLDLDPGPRAPFARIVDVARWVREELEAFDLHAAIKTSGSRGLHIYVPLPPRTPDDAALLVAQIIATRVADRHPKEATIERAVKARAASAVYVDYMQNVRGKSVSAAYCVRAKKGAPVSTPLDWEELDEKLDPLDFTIATIPARLARVGDLWNPAMRRKNSLERVLNGGAKAGKSSRR